MLAKKTQKTKSNIEKTEIGKVNSMHIFQRVGDGVNP